MQTVLYVLGGVVLAGSLLVFVVWLAVRALFRRGLRAVGEQALVDTPDAIQLVAVAAPGGGAAEADGDVAALVRDLRAAGYADAGAFAVREMPGLVVHGFVHEGERSLAAVYRHPVAGAWLDLVVRQTDGTSYTCTSSRHGGGFSPRPGHPQEFIPGADAAQLLRRFRDGRPGGPRTPVGRADFVSVFERAYAESTAWRKRRGLTPGEVLGAALEDDLTGRA